jgi:acetyl-CoA/propionyl-CoA carboxylase carboxyl transferase subunit
MTVTTAEVVPALDPRDPTARLAALFDGGRLHPLGPPAGSVRAAAGAVDGAAVVAFATDPRVRGGALDVEGCDRIVRTIEHAVGRGIPVIGLWHSGGAQVGEGVRALDAVGRVFAAKVRASGRVPQLSAILGPAAGGAAYGSALTDVVAMSGVGRLFVTGPEVVRSVTGQQVDMDQLGGPEVHGRHSGVAHLVEPDDDGALAAIRRVAGLLGRPGRLNPSWLGTRPDPRTVLPASSRRGYDVRPLVTAVLDGPPVELHPRWAPNIVTALGRLAGRTVGVIANNPLRLGGCLDSASAEKAARFVRMCDGFGVPLVVLVDVPGYLPGTGQERDGVVRRGAKLLHAFAAASVPRVTVVTRKAYGGAYIAMNSRSLGATAVFAWPGAEIAVMGAPAAVDLLHRRTLAAADPAGRGALRDRLIEEHGRTAGDPGRAVESGAVDEVIAPALTRRRVAGALAAALAAAPGARGVLGNIPL